MPIRQYAMRKGGPKLLELTWQGPWTGFEVKYNGRVLGPKVNKEDLEQGVDYQLDKKILRIKLNIVWKFWPELEISYGGKIVPDTPSDPALWLSQIFWLVILLGVINVLLGAWAWFGSDLLKEIGISTLSLIFGLVLILLSFGIKMRSILALTIVVGLYLMDIVLSGYFILNADGKPGGIVVKLFIFIFLLRGFSAIRKLRKH